jgi:hypothetical protein
MRWLALLGLAACTGYGTSSQGVSTDVRHQRLQTIRDIAAQGGLYNGALLGGIAVSETQLAHCQSEATYACQGPASSSCGGGPIIAGSADGPCSEMQGGLGMFQFDAGTYAQTIAAYGPDVLTIEGNTALAVNFTVQKVITDIAGVTDWRSATAWMTQVPLVAGDPVMEQWSHLLACRYNGCCSTSTTCTTRANGYRDNAIDVYTEMGADFWRTSDRCAHVPADGVIDQRTECYVAGGDPHYFRHETGGYGGSLEWTMGTTASAPANFAQWFIHGAGHYHLEVYLDGGTFGTTKAAPYVISHGGAMDTVVIDQTSATGFVALGDFLFTGDGTEYVLLGDNTGDATSKLLFDALRATPLDGQQPVGVDAGTVPDPSEHTASCTTGGGGAGGGVALAALLLRRRRR